MNGRDHRLTPLFPLLIVLLGLPIPAVAQTIGSLNFGQQEVGTASTQQVLPLCCPNSGLFILSQSFTVTGDFRRGANSTCDWTLGPGERCVFGVVFAPSQVGTRTGHVILTTVGAPPDAIWNLTGVGTAPPPLPPLSPCDVTKDGRTSIEDVQHVVLEILGILPPTSDINGDGSVNVSDLQRVVNAVLGRGCRTT
jgi:hypothetical protein